MKSTPLILVAGLALSLSCVGSSESSTDLGRREERRIERTLRGRTDKDTKEMEREEQRIEDQPVGGGGKYLKREQREAAKEQRRLQKLSNQQVKVKKHASSYPAQ